MRVARWRRAIERDPASPAYIGRWSLSPTSRTKRTLSTCLQKPP